MKVETKIINGVSQTFLFADGGMIVTNGKDVFGRDIRLADGVSEDSFYEISEAEYNALMEVEYEQP